MPVRIHQVATQALSNQRVTGYLPLIEDTAAELAGRMAKGGPGADLVEAFSDKFPLLVIGGLLGIPAQDLPRVRRWSAVYTQSAPTGPAERAALVAEFADYVRALTADPAAVPASPLLQDLAFPPAGGTRLSPDDLAAVVKLLLSAGTEAPTAVLDRSLLYLLLGHGRWWRLLAGDRGLSGPVVAELLRLVYAGNAAALRTAVADVRLPSGVVSAGQAVLLAWIAALHDPEVYADAASLKLDRDAPRNIGFGGGRHYCPGVTLAKSMLTVALATLAERFPGLRLAVEESAVPLAERETGSVVLSLPVTW
jgi:cytochrome P450